MFLETILTSEIDDEHFFIHEVFTGVGCNLVKAILIVLVSLWTIKKISWFNHPFQYDPGNPPFVPYLIPFVGSGFSMQRDPVQFVTYWSNYFKSNIISAYCAGKSFIIVTDALVSALIVSGRIPELSWRESKVRILRNGLKIREEAANVLTHKLNDRHIFEKHLMKTDNLNNKILRLQKSLRRNIAIETSNDDPWLTSTILNFFGKILFIAGTEVILGSSSLATEETYQLALKFDKTFYDFVRIDSLDKQKKYTTGFNARDQLIERIHGITDSGGKLSEMCADILQCSDEELTNDDEVHRLFGIHWASYTNSVPSLFWLVYNLLTYKAAYKAVKEEILSIYKEKLESKETEIKDESKLDFSVSDIDRMKNLDSVLMETFRFCTTKKSFRLRTATKDFKITLPTDKKKMQFDVKKGTMFLIGVTTLHRDEEIFKDALTFKWDRFLPSADGKRPIFTKNGRSINRPVNPFGGGTSMCPGRRFAMVELKACIATVLLEHDVRFRDDVIPPMPKHMKSYTPQSSGFPASDVYIELRKSSNQF